MPSPRRRAWILCAALLALISCKSELDDKPAADPLDDPWVDAIETGDEEQVAVAPAPAAAPAAATPATDPVAVAEPADVAAPDPATGVLATPTAAGTSSAASKAKPATPGATSTDAIEPAAAVEPTEPGAVEDPSEAPAAEPAPAPTEEPAQPATPPALTIADFHCNYRFVVGSAQRSDLEAAIETAANQLPMAIRGIGRKRLTKTNPIDDTLDIVIAGDKVTTIFETGFDATCVIDGPTVHWSNNKGDAYKVRVRAKGSKLVQIIEGEDGVKTTVFVLSSDKQKLTVHHKITADRLPEPMTYRLSYSRK